MRPSLGTWVTIETAGPAGEAAIEHAFRAIGEVGERLHPEGEGSDLRRLGEARPGDSVQIHPTTFTVLEFAKKLFALSGGVFDPCLPARPGRLSDLELGCAPQGSHFGLCRAPLLIDCGGIAKGYAIDRAVGALQAAGCESGLVNAGGDLRVFGDRPQTILVRRADGRCEPIELQDAAVAVSERASARAPRGHRGYYRPGTPQVAGRPFAAVRAADAMTADALTKCVLLCEPGAADAIVRALGGRVLA
jgi:thiamine biosynthesis lipoprotein